MLLGVHVPSGGKLYEAFDRAEALGCNTMQVFSRNPQQWRKELLTPQDIAEFKKRKEQTGITPVFVHIPYLINLASPNPKLNAASVEAYIEDMAEADAFGADYIVTHMGSHKDTSEEAGIRRLVKALNEILKKTSLAKIGMLLENTSGSGSWLGYKFSHQKKILEGLKSRERVGLCLDTAHAYLAGYDISTASGLEDLLAEIDRNVGLSLIKLVHLNDARDALGSKHDRHEHIGKGNIGLEGIKRIINHPKLKGLPFVLETPKDSEEDDKRNLNTVRRLRVEP